jgi:hypothetical protein
VLVHEHGVALAQRPQLGRDRAQGVLAHRAGIPQRPRVAAYVLYVTAG